MVNVEGAGGRVVMLLNAVMACVLKRVSLRLSGDWLQPQYIY